MATYKFSKCPYCGKSIESFKTTGWNDIREKIGSPTASCPHCFKVYRTGRIFWDNMTTEQRVLIYIRVAFGSVFLGVFLGAIISMGFLFIHFEIGLFPELTDKELVLISCCISTIGILWSTKTHISLFQDLKQLKEN